MRIRFRIREKKAEADAGRGEDGLAKGFQIVVDEDVQVPHVVLLGLEQLADEFMPLRGCKM
jgi:hypothetical protein